MRDLIRDPLKPVNTIVLGYSEGFQGGLQLGPVRRIQNFLILLHFFFAVALPVAPLNEPISLACVIIICLPSHALCGVYNELCIVCNEPVYNIMYNIMSLCSLAVLSVKIP